MIPGPSFRFETRRRGADCASDLTLDRYLLAELPEAERASVAVHLEACAACAGARTTIEADRQQFIAAANIGAFAADALARADAVRSTQPEFGRFGTWALRLAVPFAVGAAAIALWPRPAPNTRTKGAAFSLATYVLHAESNTAAAHAGEPVHPGDRLQFRYHGEHAGYLAVIAVDDTAKISIYYPPGPYAERVEGGREVPLRSAVELDQTLGIEVIVGLRCERPVMIDDILVAARRSVAAAQARGGPPHTLAPLDLPCVEMRQQLVKQPRPNRKPE